MIKTKKVVNKKLNDSFREVFQLGVECGEIEYIISDYVTTHEEAIYYENLRQEKKFRVNSIIESFAC